MKTKMVRQPGATPTKRKPDGFTPLIAEVRRLIQSARQAAASTVNTLQVLTNFEIGRRIVEHETVLSGVAESCSANCPETFWAIGGGREYSEAFCAIAQSLPPELVPLRAAFGGRPTALWNPQVQTTGANFGEL